MTEQKCSEIFLACGRCLTKVWNFNCKFLVSHEASLSEAESIAMRISFFEHCVIKNVVMYFQKVGCSTKASVGAWYSIGHCWVLTSWLRLPSPWPRLFPFGNCVIIMQVVCPISVSNSHHVWCCRNIYLYPTCNMLKWWLIKSTSCIPHYYTTITCQIKL